MKRLDDELINRTVELYKRYGSVKKVSEITGLKLNRVYAYLKLRGIDKQNEKQEKYNRIEDLLEEGYSQADIARIMGLPKGSVNVIVYRIRQQENEPIRDASEVKITHIDDPVYYVEHKATNEIYTYQGKRYRDVSSVWLGG